MNNYPCSVCFKEVKNDAIQCEICLFWVHRLCAKLSKCELRNKSDPNIYFYCPKCIEIFPFHQLDDDEFTYINSRINISEKLFNVYNKCANLTLQCFDKSGHSESRWDNNIDPDSNYYHTYNFECKYYTDNAFQAEAKNIDGLTIMHFNARSLKTNFKFIKNYVKELGKNFHIIAVSESWLDGDSDLKEYALEHYEMYNVFRPGKRGGGVALYIRNNLRATKIENKSCFLEGICEHLTVELNVEGGKNVVIACIYRTPGSELELFSNHVDNFLKAVNKNKSIYLCGDFNIDLLRSDKHCGTKHFLDMLYSYGLFPMINKPTRVTSVSATLIDNIFTNSFSSESKSGILCNDISDHLPIFSSCTHKGVSHVKHDLFKYVRKFAEKDSVKFKEELRRVDWEVILEENDVNKASTSFVKIVKDLYDKHFPIRKVRVNTKQKHKPWLTKGLLNACHKKNRLYKAFVVNKTLESERKYKTYKNKLTSVLRFSEKKYYSDLLHENRNNIKSTWKILNNAINRNKSSDRIPDEFYDSNKKRVCGKESIANGFNSFFTNVGPNLAKHIPNERGVSISDFMQETNNNSMFIEPVDENEMVKTVSKLKNKTSTDYDDMSMEMVKSIINFICKPLCHICNLSFNSGIFPDNMKIAKVIPLFKAGERNSFNNYRPVSLLPQFSKILEKLFDYRLQKFIDKHDLLSDCQYGFRQNRSTNFALMELIEEICSSLDNKKNTIGVFIDLRKAFDTLDHDLLLRKLNHYGVRGIAHEWLKSYLSNRKQFVQINDIRSNRLNILCGVPQGSILGPKLFILYINDICNVSDIMRLILFADDTNIFKSGHNLNALAAEISLELNKLQVWFNVNKLSLNVQKTNYILFGRTHTNEANEEIKIFINGKEIDRVKSTKFLGVIIDSKLNWYDQISRVSDKLSKSLAIMYKARTLLNKNALITIYNSLFLPYLTYCCEIWANTYKTKLQGLFIKQKRAIRIICNVGYYDHTNGLFLQCNMLKFFEIVTLKTASIMYNAYRNKLPCNVQSYFEVGNSINEYTTRQKDKFKTQFVRTSLKSNCISVVGVKIWNVLPDHIRSSMNICVFKKQMTKHLLLEYQNQ